MRGWLVAFALAVVVGASGVGLWVTWDETQTSSADPVEGPDLLVTTTSSPTPTTTTVPPTPPCAVADELVEGDPATDWSTIVIDRAHRLPEDFVPSDLVEVSAAGFESRDRVRAVIVDDLAALRAAAEANGTPIVVISAYRSFSYQQQLFADRAARDGEEVAARETARPGHSEHQLGTAIDVLDPGVGELTEAFAATPAGQWIAAHAHEFGFVISYPQGARDRSCYQYEPWHLRYVGRDIAADVHESGLTPREWMLARAEDPG